MASRPREGGVTSIDGLGGPPPRLRQFAPEALILCWPIAVVAWRHSLPFEVFALSGDDFSRMLDAAAVSRGALFPTDGWPPGPAWIAGALIAAGVPLRLAPAVVNLCSLTIALLLVNDIARRLGAGPAVRVLALGSAMVLRWPAWLGLSALAEPIAALGLVMVCHAALRLQASRAPPLAGEASTLAVAWARWQLIAGACLGALSRYESWAVSIGAMVILSRCRAGNGLGDRILPLLPATVPLAWCAMEYQWNGNVDFLLNARTILQSTSWRPTEGAYSWSLLTDIADALGPGAAIAVFVPWRLREDPRLQPIVSLWFATGAIYLAAGLLGFGGTHNSARLWLGHSLIVPVFIAVVFKGLGSPRWASLATGLGLAALGLRRWTPVPEGYGADASNVACGARFALAVEPGNVIIEAVPWESLAVHVLIGAPSRTIWDREHPGRTVTRRYPSMLGGTPAEMESAFAGEGAQPRRPASCTCKKRAFERGWPRERQGGSRQTLDESIETRTKPNRGKRWRDPGETASSGAPATELAARFVVTGSPRYAQGLTEVGYPLLREGDWTLWALGQSTESSVRELLEREVQPSAEPRQRSILEELERAVQAPAIGQP